MLAVMNEVSGSATLYRINLACAEPVFINIAEVGERGVTISGSVDCLYEVEITDADGNVSVHEVLVGSDGNGYLDVLVGPDAAFRVGLEGAFSLPRYTVPTLGTWGLLVLIALMVATTLFMRKKMTQA